MPKLEPFTVEAIKGRPLPEPGKRVRYTPILVFTGSSSL